MARTNAECGCAQLQEDSERNCRTLLDWCSRCRNIRIASRFALDLRPNVAGIGMLHLLATLYSDLRSDVMQRASEGEGKGSGGWVHMSGIENESCAWAGMYSSRSGWH